MSKRVIVAVAAGALLIAGLAHAHVTLQPKEAPADSFARLNVRVPNERDNARTEKVRVQFPPGFLAISYEPVDGWDIEVTKRKLDQPAELFGEPVTEEVGEVSFTAQDGEAIRPGQFRDFGLSLRIPDSPNETLAYSNGEVVRWIGPPDSEEPAAQVRVIAAAQQSGGGAQTSSAVPAAAVTEDGGLSTALVVVALVLGGLGLLVGLGGLLTARRARLGTRDRVPVSVCWPSWWRRWSPCRARRRGTRCSPTPRRTAETPSRQPTASTRSPSG